MISFRETNKTLVKSRNLVYRSPKTIQSNSAFSSRKNRSNSRVNSKWSRVWGWTWRLGLMVTVYWLLFLAPWWSVQTIINSDNRDLLVGSATEIVNQEINQITWKNFWYIPGHILMLKPENLKQAIASQLNQSDLNIAVAKKVSAQALMIKIEPVKPALVLQMTVTPIKSQTVTANNSLVLAPKYFALNSEGKIIGSDLSQRYHRAWRQAPQLNFNLNQADFLTSEPKPMIDSGLPAISNEILVGDSQANNNSNNQSHAPNSESMSETSIERQQLESMIKLNLERNPIWQTFSAKNLNSSDWIWPDTGSQLMSADAIQTFVAIAEGLNQTEVRRLIQSYNLQWPEPDKLKVRLFAGGEIYFSLEQIPEFQLSSLQQIIKQNPTWNQGLDYLDLRFGTKVYLKKR